MIERKIIIGLIASSEYLKKIRGIWDSMLLESSTARTLANWCIGHFDEYKKAPGKEIETIFFKKAKSLDKEIAEEIEEDILPGLSDEFVGDEIDVDYLLKETIKYFQSRQLAQLSTEIEKILGNVRGTEDEKIKAAEQLRKDFKPINFEVDDSIDLSTIKALKAIKRAFTQSSEPLFTFAKQLGEFWNSQFVAGAFISFLAPEKRGKTYLLLEIGMTASKQGKKVAFFQAGDMNESEQLIRLGVYLLRRSNLEKYCEEHYMPVRDCIKNQMDTCDKKERECDFGVFDDMDIEEVKEIKFDELKDICNSNQDYRPCYNCKEYNAFKLGAPWLKKVPKTEPIDYIEVQKAVKEFFHKHNRRFKLSSHANGTLTFNLIDSILDRWEEEDGFVPDVILIDYMDIIDSGIKGDFRQQENQKWKDARKLSQIKRGNILPCVISPTQSDADSYTVHRLKLGNFSEDKRKYAHVTAMYGLNQSPDGREKELGLLRINELIMRSGSFANSNEITILQNLRQGRPITGSYFNH